MPRPCLPLLAFAICMTTAACPEARSESPLHTLTPSDFSTGPVAKVDLSIKKLPHRIALNLATSRMCVENHQGTFGTDWSPARLREIQATATNETERLFSVFLELSAGYGRGAYSDVLRRLDEIRTKTPSTTTTSGGPT